MYEIPCQILKSEALKTVIKSANIFFHRNNTLFPKKIDTEKKLQGSDLKIHFSEKNSQYGLKVKL